MIVDELVKAFRQRISGTIPNDWELEEGVRPLLGLATELQQHILGQVPVIWPVSHALCFNYLAKAADCLSCLHPDQLEDWVRGLLDAYESDGLRSAQHFMEDVEKHFLCRIRGKTGLRFEQVRARLLPYVQGVSGLPLELEEGDCAFTDTARIVLPREMKVFASENEDFLFYKFAATVQCGHLHFNTYGLRLAENHPLLEALAGSRSRKIISGSSWLQGFGSLFNEPDLALDLFFVAQTARILAWIRETLAGLYRDCRPLLRSLAAGDHPELPDSRGAAVSLLYRFLLTGDKKLPGGKGHRTSLILYKLYGCLLKLEDERSDVENLLGGVVEMYRYLEGIEGEYVRCAPPLVFGRIDPQRAHGVILQRRAEDKQKFVRQLAGLFDKKGNGSQAEDKGSGNRLPAAAVEGDEGALLLMGDSAEDREGKEEKSGPALRLLTIGGREISLPDEMQGLVSRIVSDLGGLPVQYIASAAGLAGSGSLELMEVEEEAGASLQGAVLYDEWDYRRKGYKKDWCHVLEKKVSEVSGSFVGSTLDKHRGLLVKLRRQFEMMRTGQLLARRQREGDEVDLDAVIEFFADQKAKRAPNELFFTRMQRDRRDIAVHFLVDMSSSTEGWIMTAIKESLLLMGESIAVLGDRFAIYGFSGMRRLRSDIFLVKDMDEPYDDTIRRRIAGIGPQDYTRMGPPIRHLIEKMKAVEARVRLLIILSDGKPEDYDDYKGRYAIEDTRHALIEAKAAGIHPFCITVDKQAGQYIEHMYGEVNYIQINDLSQLPARMPEVYRSLTTA